jgi:hypothetical protein
MRSLKLTVVSLVVLLSALPASASCPSIWLQACCGTSWYEFDIDNSCLDSSGVSTTNLSCGAGYEHGFGSRNFTTWTYTIPADGTTINSGNTFYKRQYWSVTVFVDFSSPTQSFNDNVTGTLTVTHNGTNTWYTIFSFYGSSAASQSCTRQDVSFSATNGDIITITISSTKFNSNAVIKATLPIVFNY